MTGMFVKWISEILFMAICTAVVGYGLWSECVVGEGGLLYKTLVGTMGISAIFGMWLLYFLPIWKDDE